MIGTALRLLLAAFCFPFLMFPVINFIAIPVFVWSLVSAVRRIWRGTAATDATVS